MYQNVEHGRFIYFVIKLSKASEIYHLEPGFYHSIADIVEAMDTPFQEGHNHSECCITVKVSQRSKKMRFILQMKNLVFHSLVLSWDNFSGGISAMNLE